MSLPVISSSCFSTHSCLWSTMQGWVIYAIFLMSLFHLMLRSLLASLRFVVVVDHLLSAHLACCPDHRHFNNFIVSTKSVILFFWLIYSFIVWSYLFISNIQRSMTHEVLLSFFRVHVSRSYVNIGKMHWSNIFFFMSGSILDSKKMYYFSNADQASFILLLFIGMSESELCII